MTATLKSGCAAALPRPPRRPLPDVSVRPSTPEPIHSVAPTRIRTARMRRPHHDWHLRRRGQGGRGRALEERPDHRENLGDLAFGIEVGGGGAAHEQSVAELHDDGGDGARIDGRVRWRPGSWPPRRQRRTARAGSCRIRSDRRRSPGLRVASAQISRQSFALSCARILEMPAPEIAEGGEEVAAARAPSRTRFARSPRSRSQRPAHQRVLGVEIAVEIARAHAGFRRHVLHGRAMKAGARKATLRGIQDMRATVDAGFLGVLAQCDFSHVRPN